jgi:hypothetical protein
VPRWVKALLYELGLLAFLVGLGSFCGSGVGQLLL